MAVKKALVSRFVAGTAVKPKGIKVGTGTTSRPAPSAAAASVQALSPIVVGAAPPPTIAQVTPTPAVFAPDAGYEQTVAALGKARDTTLSALGAQRTQGMLQYGYTGDVGHLAIDPSNPFSQSAMLKRNYDQAASGNTNSYAAGGQLYSGALQHAQDETAFQRGAATNTLETNLIAFLNKNTGDATSAGINYDLGVGQARSDQLARNIAAAQAAAAAAPPPAAIGWAGTPGGAAGAAALADPNTGLSPGIFGPGGPSNTLDQPAFQAVPGHDKAGNAGVWHIYPPSAAYPNGRKVFVRK